MIKQYSILMFSVICAVTLISRKMLTVWFLANEEEKCSYKLSDVNKVFPQVKTLYIGPNVIDIVIRNAMFPNVKKVISDNPCLPPEICW